MTRGTVSRGRATPSGDKRKITRACDFCRRRKTKCDGPVRIQEADPSFSAFSGNISQVLGNARCSNCVLSGGGCTYGQDSLRKGYPKAYIKNLEEGQDKLERMLLRRCPELDMLAMFGPRVEPGSWNDDAAASSSQLGHKPDLQPETSTSYEPLRLRPSDSSPLATPERHLNTPSLTMDIKRLPTSPTASATVMKRHPSFDFQPWRDHSESYKDHEFLTSSDEEYSTGPPPRLGTDDPDNLGYMSNPRFHGTSSCFSLIRINREWKRNNDATRDSDHSQSTSANNSYSTDWEANLDGPEDPLARPLGFPDLVFPPHDLLQTLVNLYFRHVNIVWPLLHRNTFQNDLLCQRHIRDPSFGCVVLAVCAVASRYCDDIRVLAKVRKRSRNESRSTQRPSVLPWAGPDPWIDDLEQGFDNQEASYENAPACSSGWKYYDRVQEYHPTLMDPVLLDELQRTWLLQQFCLGLPNVSTGYGWVMIGAAIRKAQDRGAHRKKRYESSLDGELWKRAFWCLVVADRLASAVLGRACCSHDEDADVELPLEISDDSWPNVEGFPFIPPPNPARRHSDITAFNVYVRLTSIYGWAMRTLYATDKSKACMELSGERWEKDIVGRLNEDLDKWTATVPSHLKWNPDEPDPALRAQSANIHLTYHMLQMHIYQRFLPGATIRGLPPSTDSPEDVNNNARAPSGPPPLSALSICTHAARSNASILRGLLSHLNSDSPAQLSDVPTLVAGSFLTGIMLLTVTARKAHAIQSPKPEVSDPTSLSTGISYDGAHSHESAFEDVANNEEQLSACVETLRAVNNKWLRATSGFNLLVTTAAAGPYENLLRMHAYPASQPIVPPPSPSGSRGAHSGTLPQAHVAHPAPPFPQVIAIEESPQKPYSWPGHTTTASSSFGQPHSFPPSFHQDTARPSTSNFHATAIQQMPFVFTSEPVMDHLPQAPTQQAAWQAAPFHPAFLQSAVSPPSDAETPDAGQPYSWNNEVPPEILCIETAMSHDGHGSAYYDGTLPARRYPILHEHYRLTTADDWSGQQQHSESPAFPREKERAPSYPEQWTGQYVEWKGDHPEFGHEDL